MRRRIAVLTSAVDRILFESCDPFTAVVLRVGFAVIMLVCTACWLSEAPLWFTDEGVLRAETARLLGSDRLWSAFFLLPSTPLVVNACLWVLLGHCLFLLLGIWSRFQVSLIFVWLVSLHHRNPLILDAEDTLLRWLAFLLIFLPLDHAWSLGRRMQRSSTTRAAKGESACESAWGLRLIQLQMAVLYASAAWCKWQGATWRNGTAFYYVAEVSDFIGRVPIPAALLASPWFIPFCTYTALGVETLLPVALWFRSTRRWALVAGIGLHLAIEIHMHLFVFQWAMILGLLAFWRHDEWNWPRIWFRRGR